MGEIIETKLRRVGTSLGVLLPSEIIRKEELKEDDKIKFVLLKKNLKLIKEAFGSAKGAKFKFERDHSDRI